MPFSRFYLPSCALIFLRTYLAELMLLCLLRTLLRLYFSVHLPCCPYPAVLLFFFALTRCALIFLRAYPAVSSFFYVLRLPCCDFKIFFFALTVCHGLGPSSPAWSSPQAGKAKGIRNQAENCWNGGALA